MYQHLSFAMFRSFHDISRHSSDLLIFSFSMFIASSNPNSNNKNKNFSRSTQQIKNRLNFCRTAQVCGLRYSSLSTLVVNNVFLTKIFLTIIFMIKIYVLGKIFDKNICSEFFLAKIFWTKIFLAKIFLAKYFQPSLLTAHSPLPNPHFFSPPSSVIFEDVCYGRRTKDLRTGRTHVLSLLQ